MLSQVGTVGDAEGRSEPVAFADGDAEGFADEDAEGFVDGDTEENCLKSSNKFQ